MTGELLAEIEATLRDARQGYCRVDNRLYVTHVAALLEALKESEETLERARQDIDAMRDAVPGEA